MEWPVGKEHNHILLGLTPGNLTDAQKGAIKSTRDKDCKVLNVTRSESASKPIIWAQLNGREWVLVHQGKGPKHTIVYLFTRGATRQYGTIAVVMLLFCFCGREVGSFRICFRASRPWVFQVAMFSAGWG